jgi:hypothetical protein
MVVTRPACPHVYWHRELPPTDVVPLGEYFLEATSSRVAGTLAHRDELWDRCYEDLMAHTCDRLAQELARLGGTDAHVLEESIRTRHDDAHGEAWLQGTFRYVLYGRPAASAEPE